MKQKLIISQALMWAAAILVVALVDEKASAVPILVVLATISLGSLSKPDKSGRLTENTRREASVYS